MADLDDPATALLLDHQSNLTLGPSPLIVGENKGEMASALAAIDGCSPAVWARYAGSTTPAAPWPPAGPHSSALIRLPKGRASLAFALGAAAAVLPAGAQMILIGMNAEGIRSAAGRLAAVAEGVETLAVGHHARLLVGRRLPHLDVPHDLAGWRTHTDLPIAGNLCHWASYPGLFASNRIDDGTALLVGELPPLAVQARVLDYGCGTGLIAAHIAAARPDARLDLLDEDTLALAAAGDNVPGARLILGTRIEAVGDTRYDLIVSNPPIHQGVAEDRRVLDRLIAEAPRHLVSGGILQLVVQRRVAIAEALDRAFGKSAQIAATGQFSVFRAIKS